MLLLLLPADWILLLLLPAVRTWLLLLLFCREACRHMRKRHAWFPLVAGPRPSAVTHSRLLLLLLLVCGLLQPLHSQQLQLELLWVVSSVLCCMCCATMPG
jgi:hypothetical protein